MVIPYVLVLVGDAGDFLFVFAGICKCIVATVSLQHFDIVGPCVEILAIVVLRRFLERLAEAIRHNLPVRANTARRPDWPYRGLSGDACGTRTTMVRREFVGHQAGHRTPSVKRRGPAAAGSCAARRGLRSRAP